MFYKESDVVLLKRKIKIKILICVLSFLILLTPFIVLCFFLNDKNITLISIINTLLLSIFLILITYLIDNSILPLMRRKKTINLILRSNEKVIAFERYSIGSIKTVYFSEKAYEIELINEENVQYVLLDTNYETFLTKFSACKKVKIRQNYIVEFLDE